MVLGSRSCTNSNACCSCPRKGRHWSFYTSLNHGICASLSTDKYTFFPRHTLICVTSWWICSLPDNRAQLLQGPHRLLIQCEWQFSNGMERVNTHYECASDAARHDVHARTFIPWMKWNRKARPHAVTIPTKGFTFWSINKCLMSKFKTNE